MKGSKPIPELENLLNACADGLLKVSARRMFGCHALFANDTIFALVWKQGRIGIKLTEPAAYETLMRISGSEPWKAGAKTMSQWVLVPESFHQETRKLSQWIQKAHTFAIKNPKNPLTSKKGKP